jgi:alpha-amylase/alpha-mannosidase (GH57 family)
MLKEQTKKYIDLFFYDGSISKSVAFDNLLHDGKKFSYRLKDGYVESRTHEAQLVNIATDGERYGHHTKFGDMALAYILKVGARELGFEITNYAQFLEKFPPKYEVDIKPVSAWSCAHGVGRWMDDCGCSTGAQPHWNQKWRKPLRQALDYLRDELINLCTAQGTKYYKDFWQARNNYIDVILDRSKKSIDEFFKQNAKKNLKHEDKVKAIKLMEIQRFAQLMYTSCGWFFADISGIETTQIMKYAYRAMELASEFTKTNYEKTFLSILQKAKSNIMEFGNGKDIFNRWVKPSSVGFEKITAQFAIESSLEVYPDEKDAKLYCFNIKRNSIKTYLYMFRLFKTFYCWYNRFYLR